MLKFYNDAKLRVGQVLRDWKEKREERKATKRIDTHPHDSRFWLLSIPAAATLCAAFVEVYWAVLFCIEATGYVDWNYEGATGSTIPAASTWNMAFSAHLPVLLGLVAATVPIVMWSMVWLPVQMKARGKGRYRRLTMIVTGLLANLLVIISGTVVMNYNRQDQVRESAVTEQTAQQGRAAIDARLAFEQEQLRLALNNTNPYLNQAANVGAAEWERSYVAQARASNDPRLPMLERALGAARAADARRANIEALTVQRATAAPEAATAANVEDTVGVGLNTFAQYAEVYRPPFVALICTIIGIFGAWWWVGLAEAMDHRNVSLSGWAPEDHRIEDLRDEPAIRPERDEKGRVKMKPTRRKFTEADTGEEIEQTLVPEHYRTFKRGKAFQMETRPDIPPDETGAYDGGNRTAVTIGGSMEVESVTPPLAAGPEDQRHEDNASHEASPEAVAVEPAEVEQTDLSEELEVQEDEPTTDLEPAWAPPAEVIDVENHADHESGEAENAKDDNEQVDHFEPREEPETNPAKLIAAE